MKYVQPYGISDANASYVDGNPAQGIEGSAVPAAALEHPMREIVNAIKDAGLTPDGNNLEQLALAIHLIAKGHMPDTSGFVAKAAMPGYGTFTKRAIVTTSGLWISPVAGWYHITCIGGGGGGGRGGSRDLSVTAGQGGDQGGTTAFGAYVSAIGGSGGAGGQGYDGGGGGGPGEVVTALVRLTAGQSINCIIGAGGLGGTTAFANTAANYPIVTGKGPSGGLAYEGPNPGCGGMGAHGASQGSGRTGTSRHNGGSGGNGGMAGYGDYGCGGGGGGGGSDQSGSGWGRGGRGGNNGEDGTAAGVAGVGGNGTSGAIILHYQEGV